MSERVGERAALAFFASNLHEQVQAGKIQDAEAAAACRMLDQAGYGRLRCRPAAAAAEPARLPAGGDLMSPATRPRGGRRCSCSSCTAPPRSAAGSTPSTRTCPTTGRAILQRLYPVWALIGPGLSDPGHIEIHSRTVYLDSDDAARPARRDRRRHARAAARSCACFGVALHETLPRQAHQALGDRARHRARPSQRTRPTGSSRSTGGCSRSRGWRPTASASFPPDSLRGRFVRRALQAAVIDVILPAFAGQLLALARRRPAADARPRRARDRLPAGPHPLRHRRPGRPRPGCARSGARCSASDDLAALDELFARLIWIADGELERLDDAAREYRRIIGAPDPPPSAGGDRRSAGGSGDGGGAAIPAKATAPTPAAGRQRGSLADALEQAIAQRPRRPARAARRRTSTCSRCSRRGRRRRRGRAELGRGRGTGLPTGRMPDRGVDRPPYPDEVQHARRYATRLRQAITHGTRQIDKRTPGGRFDGRAYARGRAEQAAGRPVSTPPVADHPAGAPRRSRSRTSGWSSTPPARWPPTSTRSGRSPGSSPTACARSAGAARPPCSATAPRCSPTARDRCALVPGIRTGGGTAFAGDAIELVSDQLEMTNPRRPRFVYVLSATAAGPTPGPASSGSAGSPSSASRRSTSRSGSRRCRSSATASP